MSCLEVLTVIKCNVKFRRYVLLSRSITGCATVLAWYSCRHTSGVDRIFEWGGRRRKISEKNLIMKVFFLDCWAQSQMVILYTPETFTFVIYVNHELCYCITCLHTGR